MIYCRQDVGCTALVLFPPSRGPVLPTLRVCWSLLAGGGPDSHPCISSADADGAVVTILLHCLGYPHPVEPPVNVHLSLFGAKMAHGIMVGVERHLSCCLGGFFVSPWMSGLAYQSALLLT